MVCDLSKETERGEKRAIPFPSTLQLIEEWSYQASWGIWSEGMKSELFFKTPDSATDHLLIMECQPMKDLVSDREQKISVEVNGQFVGELPIAPRFHGYSLTIPKETLIKGENLIVFHYAYAVSRREVGKGMDERKLAVGYKRIGVIRIPPQKSDSINDYVREALKGARGRELFRIPYDSQAGGFLITRSGIFVLTAIVPDADRLAFSLQSSNKGTVTARITDLTTGKEVEETLNLDGNNSIQTILLSLKGFQKKRVAISLQAELAPGAVLRLLSGNFSEKRRQKKGGKRGEWVKTDSPPDIYVLILDAARPDHFGCYGYQRTTTPFIDRAAEDAIIYRNAFAMAPYTLCSVPTMITGLSFLDHHVVDHEDRLSMEAVTLAEYLKKKGYRSLALSATPNFSKAKGFDQGFDEFYELWPGMPDRDARDPNRLTDLFIKKMKEKNTTTPLYAQLHYVPPHEPYDPPARFDLFSDPSYRGSMDGSQQMMRRINLKHYLPDSRDLDKITALYDGNLLFADDSLGRVIHFLQGSGRWDKSSVLILSDHGEAIYEHGRIGHNDTVFEEMVKAPFILKLPLNYGLKEVEMPGQLSLEDIVPTLLHIAGITPDLDLEGVDLLSKEEVIESNKSRYLYFRSTGRFPYYGIRTPKYKLVIRDTRFRALYDIEQDPKEEKNIAFEKPDVLAGLTELLNREITRERRLNLKKERAEISSDDEKMLKSLGYLQ